MKRLKTATRTTKAFVVLLAVLALGLSGLGLIALAAPGLPAPTISSQPANPTNATSASFTYTDSSSITRFECSLDASAFSACGTSRPSTKSYPGPLAQGSHTFQVRAVSGSQTSSATAYTWAIDTVAPPQPVITTHPDDPNGTAISTFEWTDSESGLRFQCSLENKAWQSCSSGVTYVVDSGNNGLHQFAVRAIDAAGNISTAATWSWKVNNIGFTVTGNAPTLYPGVWKQIPVSIINPNNFTIYITSLNVAVSSSPSNCAASANIATLASAASSSNTFAVPANSPGTPVPVAFQPQIQLKDLPTNQDLCKGASFSLSYTGTASK